MAEDRKLTNDPDTPAADEWHSDDPNDVSFITGKRRKFTALRIPSPKKPEPPSQPPSTGGVKVPGQTAGDSLPTEQERADAEALQSMPEQFRKEYEAADAEQKEMLLEAAKETYEAAQKRKQENRRLEQDRTKKTLDMLQRIKEDPSKAHLLPPDDASMDDLHKWAEEISRPVGRPFGSANGGAGASSAPLFRETKRKATNGDGKPRPPTPSKSEPKEPEKNWFDHGIWANPLFLGILAMIAFAISFSPRASTLATWFCLLVAWLLASRLIHTQTQRFSKRCLITCVLSAVVGLLLAAFGWWLVLPIKATLAQSPAQTMNKDEPVTMRPYYSSPLRSPTAPSLPRTKQQAKRGLFSGTVILRAAKPTTVLTAAVTATSKIQLLPVGDSITGSLHVINIVPGVSFDVYSDNGADSGKVSWAIIP